MRSGSSFLSGMRFTAFSSGFANREGFVADEVVDGKCENPCPMPELTSPLEHNSEVVTEDCSQKDQPDGQQGKLYKGIINDWIAALTDQEERNEKTGEAFNPLNFLSIKETEHSKIIGDLLNPKGSHGQKHFFLNRLLGELGVPDLHKKQWHVTVEKDRVDIMLRRESPRSVIIIESKANEAGDQDNQIYRYWHRHIYPHHKSSDVSNHFQVVYLSRNKGDVPSEQSLSRPSDLSDEKLPARVPLECTTLSMAQLMQLWSSPEQKDKVPSRLLTFLDLYTELWPR